MIRSINRAFSPADPMPSCLAIGMKKCVLTFGRFARSSHSVRCRVSLCAGASTSVRNAGGNWLSNAAIPVLEREFGRPVITNPAASYWAFMRQLGKCSPRRGFGTLIDSLATAP